MTTSTVICDASQTPADFTTNLFSRQKEDTFLVSNSANNVCSYPGGAEEAMLRLKSQHSSRSLQTISSAKSNDKKPVRDFKGLKSNLSQNSNIISNQKDYLIVDSNVADEPQSLYGDNYEGTKSLSYDNNDIGFPKVELTQEF